jgi:hypothetical protein
MTAFVLRNFVVQAFAESRNEMPESEHQQEAANALSRA